MKSKNLQILNMKADILKAIAHPSRIMMVEELEQGERCVCELQELVGADMSTVSKHLSVLKNAGIVQSEKRGLSVYYTLSAQCIPGFLTCIENMIITGAEGKSSVVKACLCK